MPNRKLRTITSIGKHNNPLGMILRGIAFPLIILFLWELGVKKGFIDPFFLPAPSEIALTFSSMLKSGLLAEHFSASFSRLFYGFFITITIAVPLGIIVGRAKYFKHWVTPTLSFLQQIPPIAWIPIFILWLGIEEAPKIAVIVYASFFPVFLNTVQGVSSVDPKLKEAARSFMLSPLEMIFRLYIPSALMSIFVGLRLGLSNCWRALVGAELIAASSGIGSLITEGRDLAQSDKIFVAVFSIGIAGLLIDFLLRKLEVKLMPWKTTS